jgi:hypothetical protein
VRYLVPRPFPDELLGSIWVRTVRRAGLPVRTVARVLTGGRKWAPGLFTAGHIREWGALLGIDPVEVLWKHTVFPYATAFFERPVFDAALAAALATGEAAIGMGAVTQSVSDHVRLRRFCAACAREERRRWGESYWHRGHNLPGVLLCLRHDLPLRETELQTTGWDSWDERLPHELPSRRPVRRRIGAFDAELARRSLALLDRERAWSGAPTAHWYRTQLVKKGLLTATRSVNSESMARWVRGCLTGPATDYGFNQKDSRLDWLALTVRPRSGHPFVPLKHLVLQTALAVPADTARQSLDHIPSGPSARSKVELDRGYATAVRAIVAGYAKRKERVRIQDALREAGCWSAFRRARQEWPLVAKAVQHLKTSRAAMRPKRARETPADRCRGEPT